MGHRRGVAFRHKVNTVCAGPDSETEVAAEQSAAATGGGRRNRHAYAINLPRYRTRSAGRSSSTWSAAHAPSSGLRAHLAVSARALGKHLAVLQRSGLIARWKVGRVHYCRLVASLARAGAWIAAPPGLLGAPARCARRYVDEEGAHAICPPTGKIGIELQRTFRASPERVFRAWTQPAALREWWCPSGWVAGEIEIDLRSAAPIALRCPAPQTVAVSVSGQFLEVRPPERLVYTWRWEGAFAEMPETLVTLELQGSDDETHLTLHHDNFADAGIRQQHRSGWMAACDRLDRVVTPTAVMPHRAAAL